MGRVSDLSDMCETEDKAVLILVDRFASKLKSVEKATKTKLDPDPMFIAKMIKQKPKKYIKLIDLPLRERFENLDKIEIKGGTPMFKTMFKQSLEAYIKSLISLKKNGKMVDMKLLLEPFLKMKATPIKK